MTGRPVARDGTPLARKLKERIRREGPISVADYMQACLQDPEHGYYRKQQAIGAGGDFITAPEISQIFGELIGLWCAVVWQQMGSPGQLNLVELGPGRGTLMLDAMRASRIVPGFHDAISLHLVESNAALVAVQRETLGNLGMGIAWHADFPLSLPSSPALIIANEYLDTLPINQAELHEGCWHARQIGLDETGRFKFEIGAFASLRPPDRIAGTATDGDIWEHCAGHSTLAGGLEALASGGPLAALLVDYGAMRSSLGDTLQSVRSHESILILDAPGQADLTALVDFESVAAEAARQGLATDGPITQAEFLGQLGVIERASRLMAANPGKAGSIESGVARLLAPNGMGGRFKALGIRSSNLSPLPGFASVPDSG